MSTPLPQVFLTRLQADFGKETAQRVHQGLQAAPSISVRINGSKPTRAFDHLPRVPWSKSGFLLKERPAFALDPHLHAGSYYVQDSSSMILEAVLDQLPLPQDGLLALDACAAPGGKSLTLLDRISPNGFLVANEVDSKRNAILGENLLKWGAANHAVTQLSATAWAHHPSLFDLIVVDAPCSGEGMFRKDDFARQQWSEALVQQCATMQSSILDALRECLKPGGFLVYSTCTMNRHENEAQLERLLHGGFEMATPELRAHASHLVPAYLEDTLAGHYLLPGISTGEGLFISVLRKQGDTDTTKPKRSNLWPAFNASATASFGEVGNHFTHTWSKGSETYGVFDPLEIHTRLPPHFPLKSAGLPAFEPKGKHVVPLHGLAMHPHAHIDLELNLEDALNYLRKQSISASQNKTSQWTCVGYEQRALGWVKAVPGRMNNYYPNHFRLRM